MTQAKAKFLSRSATQAPHPALPILGRNLRCWISVVIPAKDPFASEARDNALLVRKVMVSTLNQWHFAPFVWDERILVHTLSLILNPQLFVNGAWSFSEVDTARELVPKWSHTKPPFCGRRRHCLPFRKPSFNRQSGKPLTARLSPKLLAR